jgi:plastocyanin
MKNTGAAPHTFTNADLKVDVNADAGKSAEIKLTDVKPGTYKFVCKYHEALNMVGELKVS